jgi:hypothetical protein
MDTFRPCSAYLMATCYNSIQISNFDSNFDLIHIAIISMKTYHLVLDEKALWPHHTVRRFVKPVTDPGDRPASQRRSTGSVQPIRQVDTYRSTQLLIQLIG